MIVSNYELCISIKCSRKSFPYKLPLVRMSSVPAGLVVSHIYLGIKAWQTLHSSYQYEARQHRDDHVSSDVRGPNLLTDWR